MLDGIPLPAAVAARPRDSRGYPALAITPWQDGAPQFAATGTARSFVCAAERRCSVCGTPMPPGPVWRVVAGPEADAIAAAQDAGTPYRNRAATQEAPGHRACMLFAAIACPYLARPNARRGVPAAVAGLNASRGAARGLGGAVAGFDEYEAAYQDGRVLFRFAGLREFRRHDLGAEHLDALARAVAAEDGAPVPQCPDYLLTDEAAAERRFAELLRPPAPSAQTNP
jgi:hypothetical protein